MSPNPATGTVSFSPGNDPQLLELPCKPQIRFDIVGVNSPRGVHLFKKIHDVQVIF